MNPLTYNAQTTTSAGSSAPTWLGPALVVTLVAGIYLVSKKREEVAENPLVDILVLAIGVLAIAHIGKWLFTKTNSPGLAKFFVLGSSPDSEGY